MHTHMNACIHTCTYSQTHTNTHMYVYIYKSLNYVCTYVCLPQVLTPADRAGLLDDAFALSRCVVYTAATVVVLL